MKNNNRVQKIRLVTVFIFIIATPVTSILFTNCNTMSNLQSQATMSTGIARDSSGDGFIPSPNTSIKSDFSTSLRLLNGEQIAHSYMSLLGKNFDPYNADNLRIALQQGTHLTLNYQQYLEEMTAGGLIATINISQIACRDFVMKELQTTPTSRLIFQEVTQGSPVDFQNQASAAIQKLALLVWGRYPTSDEILAFQEYYQGFQKDESLGDTGGLERNFAFYTSICSAVLASVETITY